MKTFFVSILALAAAAAATPVELEARGCTPGTYQCAKNPTSGVPGWQVCDVSGNWVYAGDCPSGSRCEFYFLSPYCIPNGQKFP